MTTKNYTRYVIFSGANERAIIASCRYFISNKIRFSIISRPAGDKVTSTSYRRYIHAIRKQDELDIEDMLHCVKEITKKFPTDKLMLLPTAESINRIYLNFRQRFITTGLHSDLCDEETYMLISNKSSFIALLESFGLEAPKQINDPCELDIPFVAKPLREFSQQSGEKLYPELILDNYGLSKHQKIKNKSDYFYQKYIDGASYYFLMRVNKDGTAQICYQRNLLQQANGKSMIAAQACDCPDLLFEQRIIDAFTSVDFYGLVMVEIMISEGKSWVIEANPRLWGPFQLAIQQGMSPVDNLVNSKKENKNTSNYLWLNGLIETWVKGGKVRDYFSLNESSLFFILKSIPGDIYLHRDTWRLFFLELRKNFSMYYFNKLNVFKWVKRNE